MNSIETGYFSESQCQKLVTQAYSITPESNRMGIRLNGEPLTFEKEYQIISSGLTLGSIQIPPSGQPIISSVDGQTIGGYPRIANIITADLSILAQLKPNDKISFSWVDKAKAHALLKDKHEKIKYLFG